MSDVANLKAAFDKYGVPYTEYSGWVTRGRPYAFEPKGLVLHHDASPKGPSKGVDGFIVRGTSSIPGPLSQLWASKSSGKAQIHLLAGGRADHAGIGGGSTAAPAARWIPSNSGNKYTVGLEWDHTTGETPDAEVYTVIVQAIAAIFLYNGWSVSTLVGHKEYAPGRKVDPYGVSMDQVRTDVAEAMGKLKDGAAVVPPVAIAPTPKVPVPSKPTAPSTGVPNIKNLKFGTRHADIKNLQLQLRKKGYSKYNPSGATGFYGNETKNMLAAFQRAQGWSGQGADGLPGPKTLAALYGSSSSAKPAAPAAAPTIVLANLKYKAKNEDVKQLQLLLRKKGYANLNPSGATGYYGPQTRNMVRAFQRAQGWKGSGADGYMGPLTLKRLLG